jgi:predicted transcriptional regulator of viral defense system
MKYSDLLSLTSDLPVIESTILRGFVDDVSALAVQLSRWSASRKLVRLRRGIYLLPRTLRKVEPPLEYLANLVVRPSFVSLESALSFHGIIPEAVSTVRSITTGRGGRHHTPEGDFEYRHIAPERFFGYRRFETGEGEAMVATPERALLDVVYCSKGEYSEARVGELRLQSLERLDGALLIHQAGRFLSPRISRAATMIARYIENERLALVTL